MKPKDIKVAGGTQAIINMIVKVKRIEYFKKYAVIKSTLLNAS